MPVVSGGLSTAGAGLASQEKFPTKPYLQCRFELPAVTVGRARGLLQLFHKAGYK